MGYTTTSVHNSDDHVYVDVSFFNDSSVPVPISFNATNTTNILENASEYYFSIIRMTCDISALRIFKLEDNLASVTLSYGGVDEQVFVNQSLIPTYLRNADDVGGIYTYDAFLAAINAAFTSAFNALAISSPGFDPTVAPRLVYDGPNNGLILRTQLEYATDMAYQNIEVYINTNLESYIQGFDGAFNSAATNGKNFQFAINKNISEAETVSTTSPLSLFDPNLPQPVSGTTILKMQQQFQTFYNWYDFRSLIVISNTLPISTQLTENQNQLGLNTQIPIITDFIPTQFGVGSDTLSRLEYLPTAEYRLLDMNSSSPIKTIDFKVLWTSRSNITNGTFTPNVLELAPGQEFTMKILFVKRSKYMGTSFPES